MLHFQLQIHAKTEDYDLRNFIVTDEDGLSFPVTVMIGPNEDRTIKISPWYGVDEAEVMMMLDYILSVHAA